MKELYSKTDNIFSGAVSILGAVCGISELIILMTVAGVTGSVSVGVCSCIYGISMILCCLVSAVYHFFSQGTVKNILKKFSVSCFFLMSAATVLPLCILSLDNTKGIVLLVFTCLLLLVPVVLTFIDGIRFGKLTVVLFAVMQLFPLIFSADLIDALTADGFILYAFGITLILLGGIFYIIKRHLFHTVWHVFVLTGYLLQFFTLELNVFSIELF